MGYYEYFAKVAKADAKKSALERAAKIERQAARRAEIQPRLDALSKEADDAIDCKDWAWQDRITKEIDALLDSVRNA